MAGAPPIIPRVKFTSSLGVPISGGTLTVYLAGTTTLTDTWQDKGQLSLNTNPITLDANGECLLWLDPTLTYKFLLKDAAGATVSGWPVDNILPGGIEAVTSVTSDHYIGTANANDTGTPFAVFKVDRTYTGSNSPHGFRDQTVFNPGADNLAVASFDSQMTSGGSTRPLNHIISFQSRNTHAGSGDLTDMYGYGAFDVVSGPVTTYHGVYVSGPSGAGALTNSYGVHVANMGTHGTTRRPLLIDSQSSGNEALLNCDTRIAVGSLSIGSNCRMILGDGANNYKSINYNVDPAVGQHVITDIAHSLDFGASDFAFKHSASAVAGTAVSWTTLTKINLNSASANYGALYPGTDNTRNLGISGTRWKEIFCANGTINTSDAREKTQVRPLSTAEIAAAKDLAREIGAFQWLAAVKEKGNAARHHVGMTVQRAVEIMAGHGLDPMAYGFICYDTWGDEFEDEPELRERVTVPAEVIEHEAQHVDVPEQSVTRKAFATIQGKREPVEIEDVIPAHRRMVRPPWVEVVKQAEVVDGPVIRPARRVKTKAAGDSYGFRTEQLLLFIARGFEARLADIERRMDDGEAQPA